VNVVSFFFTIFSIDFVCPCMSVGEVAEGLDPRGSQATRSLTVFPAILSTYSCANQSENRSSPVVFFCEWTPSVALLWKGGRCILRLRNKVSIINRGDMSDTHQVTLLLAEWAKGNEQARDDLTPLVYRELRKLAASYLRKELQGHTLQPTALVHEAYLRLVDQTNPSWQNRSHFYGVAARLMRQILVDHARRKQAGKRVGLKVPLDEAVSFQQERSRDLVALDAGLNALEKIDPRKCKAVELRYFGGLSMDEIAQTLDVSTITVRRDLRMAEAWLHSEMQGGTVPRDS
jgi:RNA polymerase sigma-70 factor, ECF subfamily